MSTLIIAIYLPALSQGWYMYVGTTPDSGAAYAVLSSRMHRNAAATCEVRFWYHMLGDEIGNLQVWIQEQYFLMLPWFKSGNQGDRWQEGIAGLGRIPDGFNVRYHLFVSLMMITLPDCYKKASICS